MVMRAALAVAKTPRWWRRGLTMGLGTSRCAMEIVWSDLRVVARTLGREGTKSVGLYLIVNQSCTTLGH